MILSKNDVTRYVPGRFKDMPEAKAPAYFYRAVTKLERAQHGRDVSAAGARCPSQAELISELRVAVNTIVLSDDRPILLELIDNLQAQTANEQDLSAAKALENVVRANWPAYAKLLADREYYMQVASLLAFKRFVTGWENVDVPFVTTGRLLSEDSFEAVDSGDAMEVGWAALLASSVTAGDEKKSPSPSPSGDSPQPSAASSQPMEAEVGSSPV